MANPHPKDNFKNFKGSEHKLTKENNRNGGIKSQQVQREKKIIKEEILKMMGEEDWFEFIKGIIDRGKKDTKSAEFLRDTIGQKPIDKQEIIDNRPVIIKTTKEQEEELNKRIDDFITPKNDNDKRE